MLPKSDEKKISNLPSCKYPNRETIIKTILDHHFLRKKFDFETNFRKIPQIFETNIGLIKNARKKVSDFVSVRLDSNDFMIKHNIFHKNSITILPDQK